MDSIPLEMDDIFEDYEEAEDFNPTRLPDLEDELEPLRNGDGENEDQLDNPEILNKLKSMKGASKNIPKRSIPKLNADRLIGERGIPALPLVFKKVPLLGRNHEVTDLKVIMRHLEHWGHRLFPKMPFAEVLERVERLGAKKEVQNCVKRIRQDLPVASVDDEEDDVQRHTVDDEEDDVQRQSQPNGDRNTSSDQHNDSLEIDETEIEDLLREQSEPISSQIQPTENDRVFSSPMVDKGTKQVGALSDELREKIERNKMLALSKRAAKLKEKQSTSDNNANKEVDPAQSIDLTNESAEHNDGRAQNTVVINELDSSQNTLVNNYLPETTNPKDKSIQGSNGSMNLSQESEDEESNHGALFIDEDEQSRC